MENGAHVDENSLNIQNEYFNNARKNRTRVTVFLTNGQRITGLIRSFDKFTVILETRNGDQMVFKHAITSVAAALPPQHDTRGPRPSQRLDQRPQPGGGRPRPPHAGGPGGPPHAAVPGHAAGQQEGARGGTDPRPRASSGPQGRSFGNYMDLSGVKVGTSPGGPAVPPAEQPASQPAAPPAAPEPEEQRPAPEPAAEGTAAPPASETEREPSGGTETGSGSPAS